MTPVTDTYSQTGKVTRARRRWRSKRPRNAKECAQSEKRHDRCEHDVGKQNAQVEDPNETCAPITDVPGAVVVHEVRNEEQNRDHESTQHEPNVLPFAPPTDRPESTYEKRGCHRVETGIHVRKSCAPIHRFVTFRLPAHECGPRDAEGRLRPPWDGRNREYDHASRQG